MDMRVFPFSFPPIRGGAQGGVSPTPTPDPEPETPLYDLTNISVVIKSYSENWEDRTTFSFISVYMDVSGIVVNDSSGVSSVEIDLNGLTYTAGGSPVTVYGGNALLNAADPNISDKFQVVKTTGGITSTVGISSGTAKFIAYDSNGEKLQEDNISVVVS
jgi:hypothetical protein